MLEVNYLGFKLKNPLIAGSSGLTATIQKLSELESQGIGAVVLKSIFEEDIYTEYNKEVQKKERSSEFLDTLDLVIREQQLEEYVHLIRDAKQTLAVPVIASINCTSAHEWSYFAKEIEKAGADVLELNIYEIPKASSSAEQSEKRHLKLVNEVTLNSKIPVAVKISPFHTSVANFCIKLQNAGVSGITLFNRFLSPDFDVRTFEFKEKNKYSQADEYFQTLRWTNLLSNQIDIPICASCGIHDSDTILKMLAAGASATQLVSTLYKNGVSVIPKLIAELQQFFNDSGFESLADYQKEAKRHLKPEQFTRAQFVRLKQQK